MTIVRTCALLCGVGIALVVLAGCASRQHKRPDELGAKETVAGGGLADYSEPLDLREFEVDATEAGYRGVFLKLSRLPSAVSAMAQEDPPRIIVDIQGPTGGESPEEVFPGGDTVVTHVGVSRTVGNLRVILDLDSDRLPEYGVFPMADWVLVRIKPTNLKPRPWAHRAS
jgi:hypothetical protein